MFRKMRRVNQELTKEKCINILKSQPRGVLAIAEEDSYPYALPMNYIYLNEKLYFHTAKSGHKLDALEKDNRVSFCVMDEGFHKEDDWALFINSIIVFGKINNIKEHDKKLEILKEIHIKYYPDSFKLTEEKIEQKVDAINILELSIDYMFGKIVHEK